MRNFFSLILFLIAVHSLFAQSAAFCSQTSSNVPILICSSMEDKQISPPIFESSTTGLIISDPARLITLTPFSLNEILSGKKYSERNNAIHPEKFIGTYPSINSGNHLYTPGYTQGFFCNFEDYINKGRKLRIDFSVR